MKAEEARALAGVSLSERDKTTINIVSEIENLIEKCAKKGEYSLTIEVNDYVNRYCTKDTEYDLIAKFISEIFKKNDFTVKRFSNYKEESMTISW